MTPGLVSSPVALAVVSFDGAATIDSAFGRHDRWVVSAVRSPLVSGAEPTGCRAGAAPDQATSALRFL